MDRNYCRLCLKQDTWNSPLSVFADGNLLQPKIFLVHGIQILENDPFSKVICHLCLAKLEFMDGIRRKVAISNSILNGIVQAGENVLASETRAVPQMDEAETVLELLRCDKCQFTTNQASQLTAHSELHTSLASRHCPRCSLTVQTERELAHHLKTKHKNRTLAIHYCVQCAKLVYGNEQFNEHSKQHDPDSVRQHHTAKKKHKRVKSKASPVAAHRERIVLKISKTTDDNSDLTTTNPVENNRSSSSDVVIDHSDVERITPTNQTHLQRCEESQTCHNRTETTEKTQITSIERILGSEKLQTFHNRGQTTGKSQTTSTESNFKTQTTSKENSCETTGKSQTTSKESSFKTTGKSQTISKESISQTAGKSQTTYKDNFIGRSETSHTISDKVSVPKNHKTKGVSKTIQTEECRLSYLNNNIPGQSETDMNRVCVPGHTKSSHNEKHGLSASKNYERDFGSETLGCNQFGTNDASELVDLIDSENEMQTKRNNNNSRMATMDSDKIYTEQVNDNRMATSRKRLLSTDSDEMHTKQDNDKSPMSTMDSDEIHTKQENDKNRIATSRKRFSSTHLPAVGKLQRQMDFNVGGDWWDPISASQRIYIDVDKDDDVCRPPTLSSTSEVSCPSFESLELEDVIEIKDEYLSD